MFRGLNDLFLQGPQALQFSNDSLGQKSLQKDKRLALYFDAVVADERAQCWLELLRVLLGFEDAQNGLFQDWFALWFDNAHWPVHEGLKKFLQNHLLEKLLVFDSNRETVD